MPSYFVERGPAATARPLIERRDRDAEVFGEFVGVDEAIAVEEGAVGRLGVPLLVGHCVPHQIDVVGDDLMIMYVYEN